jgi:two-component system LytT family sensor kinase
MPHIELEIKPLDWLYILFTGIVFATILSLLGYRLLGAPLLDGVLFGAILGFCITLFSLLFITFMNRVLLPKVAKRFWLAFAIVFSFASGCLGTLFAISMAHLWEIYLVSFFHYKSIEVSIIIGVLTYMVGVLLYRFVRIRNQKEQVDHHYIESRLRSLEQQLNPHFLFNALNSIAELIHQNPNKAEDAVLKVSAFLRNSMEESATISLTDEVSNVQAYVELENIRFLGMINFSIQGELPMVIVPKFSIQLLVENAIKHGKKSGEELAIELSYNASEHRLEISNNGKEIQGGVFGIGLSNLQQRLKLLCGGEVNIASMNPPTFYIYLGGCNEDSYR